MGPALELRTYLRDQTLEPLGLLLLAVFVTLASFLAVKLWRDRYGKKLL